MPNIINLYAEAEADYVSDDTATPGFTFRSTATEGVALGLNRSRTLSSPTVALLALGIGSAASAPVFELREQSFVSATTILTTTGGSAGTGAIRVKYGDNYGWIPIFPTGAVTAAAR